MIKKPKILVHGTEGVIGIDEVGRGPLAGPVTVCAVYLADPKKIRREIFGNIIRDSKRIKKTLRNNIFLTIRKNRKNNKTIIYSIRSKSAAYIDKYGIQRAAQVCVDACVQDLAHQGVDLLACSLRTDAGLRVSNIKNQKAYIRGDERFAEIALASIMAKETRDRYMRALSKKHNEYLWETNAGYGTKIHREAIFKFGITSYHRISYLKAFKLFDKTE